MRRFITDARTFVALASFVLSAIAVLSDSVINTDGTLYVRAAERMQEGDWAGALRVYNWPLYPGLIACASSLSRQSPEVAAHVVNALLTALAGVAFVSVVGTIKRSRKLQVAAAIVFLTFATLNEYRSQIIRDPGYLAFYLLALFFLFRFRRQPSWLNGIAWGMAMSIAVLFRVDGVIVLTFAPLVLFLDCSRTVSVRCRIWLQGNSVLLFAGGLLLLFGLLGRDTPAWEAVATSRLADPVELLQPLERIVFRTLPNKAEVLSRTLLDELSAGFAPAVVVITLITILAWESLSTLTLLNAFLAALGLRWGFLRDDRPARRLWLWLLLLNVSLLAVITIINFHLTERSALAFAITVLIAAPFGLDYLFEHWRQRRGTTRWVRWVFPLVCVWIVAAGIDGWFSFGPSKGHIKEAGIWIRENSPANATLFTNDTILAHYAERHQRRAADMAPLTAGQVRAHRDWPDIVQTAKSGAWKQYEVLAVRIRRKHPGRAQILTDLFRREPVKVCRSRRGDQVLVFFNSD